MNPIADPIPAAQPQPPAFERLTHFAGFDWGMQQHQICLVDKQGKVLFNIPFSNDAEGWADVAGRLAPYSHPELPDGPCLAVAIETSSGPAVERLLDMGQRIYPVNPKAAERFRDRKSPSGVKDDALDAWALADALRTDGHGWRALLPLDPLTAELRILCRDEIALIEQRTALVLQLKAALHEFFPVALQAFDDWTHPACWDFILTFPTPHAVASAGKRKWERFLHAHKLARPQTMPKRLELFAKATSFVSPSKAVTNAKSLMAVTIAKQLRALEPQLEAYRHRITQLFNEHPDHDSFGSLPGAGPKLAPRLLGEFGADRARFESHESVQCYAGVSPATRRSGQTCFTKMRYACNKVLRATLHMWADLSRSSCAWAQAYYKQKREQGKGHATALRCLAQRWLKILWKMWQDHTTYNEALHTQNQVRHGSWVIALTPSKPAVLNQ